MVEPKIMPVPDRLFPPSLDNSEEEISRTSWTGQPKYTA